MSDHHGKFRICGRGQVQHYGASGHVYKSASKAATQLKESTQQSQSIGLA